MRNRWRAYGQLAALLCCCATTMLACSAGGPAASATPPPGATATSGPPPCATHATTTALAWVVGQQVVGKVPASASATTVSHFVYPLGIPDEGAVGNAPQLTFMAFAPDAAHLAVAVAQFVPFQTEYDPYIVDTATHAVTRIPLATSINVASEDTPHRLFAWADTHTLIIFTASSAQRYDLTTNTLTPLPGISGAVEGVVRCSTLFYSAYPGLNSASNPVVSEQLNRYDLTTSAPIGAPITIGNAGTWGGGEGHVEYGGWDVSPDGAHLAYQSLALTETAGGGGLNESSHWYTANVDGSGATSILPSATANAMAYVSISPDGAYVAVTNANPTPNVLSGPLAGGATRFYDSPSGYSQLAWSADSSGFYAGTSGDPFTPGAIALYPIGAGGHATGSTAVAGANAPASLP